MNCFSNVFSICQIKRNYQRKRSTLKHAVVNNNKFLSQNGINRHHYKLMKSQVMKNKVVSSVLHDIIEWQIFTPRKKSKISFTSISKTCSYLFKHFYFFCYISTQFTDFASLKIPMQITIAKSFIVLSNAA